MRGFGLCSQGSCQIFGIVADLSMANYKFAINTITKRLWVVKKLSDLEMSELRRIKDSTVLPLNLAVKTLLLT